jgi:hypothetical protein
MWDLVRPLDQAEPNECDYDTLNELITSVVTPTTWVDAGGSGTIGGFRGTLVIGQNRDVLPETDKTREQHHQNGTNSHAHGDQHYPAPVFSERILVSGLGSFGFARGERVRPLMLSGL